MLTYAQCEACEGLMFLTCVEPHHSKDNGEFRIFECTDCTAITVIIPNLEAMRDTCIPPHDYWQRRFCLSQARS